MKPKTKFSILNSDLLDSVQLFNVRHYLKASRVFTKALNLAGMHKQASALSQ